MPSRSEGRHSRGRDLGEARKNLELVLAGRHHRPTPLEITRFTRHLSDREVITREQTTRDRGYFVQPFSAVSGEILLSDGFVQSVNDETVYYAPDAALFLSDAFAGVYCFRAVLPPRPKRGEPPSSGGHRVRTAADRQAEHCRYGVARQPIRLCHLADVQLPGHPNAPRRRTAGRRPPHLPAGRARSHHRGRMGHPDAAAGVHCRRGRLEPPVTAGLPGGGCPDFRANRSAAA